MRLPPALQPWAHLLGLFPQEIAQVIGGHVLRLAQVIGVSENLESQSAAEPDGYSGLTTRGKYEQLLVSEWSLADELPDEFMRRAAMREHLFLQRKLSQPASGRADVLLIDAGPDQLGTPRIAHLAVLILMAQRCELARSEFQWGVLQSPHEGLNLGLKTRQIDIYLRNPAASIPQQKDWELWQEKLALNNERIWCLTNQAIRINDRLDARQIRVWDILEPSRSALRIEYFKAGKNKQLELELPKPELSVRILRDPFDQRSGATHFGQQVLKGTKLYFGAKRSISLELENRGGCVTYSIPNSPHALPGRPRVNAVPDSERLVAVVTNGKGMVPVTEYNNYIFIHGYGFRNRVAAPRTQEIFQPQHELSSICEASVLQGNSIKCLVVNWKNTLSRLSLSPTENLFKPIASNVIAFASTSKTVWYVSLEGFEAAEINCYSVDKQLTFTPRPLNLERINVKATRFFFGQINAWPGRVFYASLEKDVGWTIHDHDKRLTIAPAAGVTIVGVVKVPTDETQAKRPVLVGYRPGKPGIELIGENFNKMTFITREPIDDAKVHLTYPYLAYRTNTGRVTVMDLNNGNNLLQIEPESK